MHRVPAGTVVVFALLVVATASVTQVGCIDFTYIRRIDNDPLSNPLRVVRADGSRLELEDGRTFDVMLMEEDLAQLLSDSNNRVEVEPTQYTDHYCIYGRRERFICGMGAPPIRIPLIPLDVPRYERSFPGISTLVKPSSAEAKPHGR